MTKKAFIIAFIIVAALVAVAAYMHHPGSGHATRSFAPHGND
jgi:hypothetical protein